MLIRYCKIISQENIDIFLYRRKNVRVIFKIWNAIFLVFYWERNHGIVCCACVMSVVLAGLNVVPYFLLPRQYCSSSVMVHPLRQHSSTTPLRRRSTPPQALPPNNIISRRMCFRSSSLLPVEKFYLLVLIYFQVHKNTYFSPKTKQSF